jgi:hypothetical protein
MLFFMNRYARVWVVVLAGILACAHPKTTEEYRVAAREGRGALRIATLDLRLPYRKVYGNLKAFSDQCLNRSQFEHGGGFGNSMRNFESEVVPLSKSKAEMYMTINSHYWIVTDLEAVKSDRTTVTIYTHWKPYIEQVTSWASGDAHECDK